MATKAAWKQSDLASYSRASGKAAAGVFLDLEKAYELVSHWMIKDQRLQQHFPGAILRLAIRIFEPRRFVPMDGACRMVRY